MFIPKDFLALFGKNTSIASSSLQKAKGRANLLGPNPGADGAQTNYALRLAIVKENFGMPRMSRGPEAVATFYKLIVLTGEFKLRSRAAREEDFLGARCNPRSAASHKEACNKARSAAAGKSTKMKYSDGYK